MKSSGTTTAVMLLGLCACAAARAQVSPVNGTAVSGGNASDSSNTVRLRTPGLTGIKGSCS